MNLAVYYLLMLVSIVPSRVFAALNGTLILFGVLLGLLIYHRKPPKEIINPQLQFMLKIILLVSISLGIIFRLSLHQVSRQAVMISQILQTFALMLVFLTVYRPNKQPAVSGVFKLLVVIAVILRLILFFSAANPQIDVYVQLKEAPQKLFIEGKNPYKASYTQIYNNTVPDYFNYLPGTIMVFAPFSLLLGDPRLLLFMAELYGAFLIYRLSDKRISRILCLLYLYNPVSLFVLESSWVEPLIFALLGLLIISLKRRLWLQPVALGVLLSVKQSFIALPIYIYRSRLMPVKRIFMAICIFSLIVLPFVFWSWGDFLADTVFYFGKTYLTGFTLSRLVGESLGLRPDSIWLFLIAGIISLLAIFWQKKNYRSFLMSLLISQLGLYIFGPQAFINYYYLASIILLLIIGLNYDHI